MVNGNQPGGTVGHQHRDHEGTHPSRPIMLDRQARHPQSTSSPPIAEDTTTPIRCALPSSTCRPESATASSAAADASCSNRSRRRASLVSKKRLASKSLDLGGNVHLEIGMIELRDGTHAGYAGDRVLPGLRQIHAKRINRTHARDHNPFHLISR